MKKKLTDIISKCLLAIVSSTFVLPMLWMIVLSFKSKSEVYANPFGLPKEWIFTNYKEALTTFDFLLYLKNSVIYTVGTIGLTLLLGSMLAYCLSRMNWRFGKFFLNYISLGLVIPVQVVIISLFLLIRRLGLNETYFALILPYTAFALASCVLMLYAFFRTLPTALEEAAYIDGCNIYQVFLHVILPLVKPAFATQTVLIFMKAWNEFFVAFIIATKTELRPLTIGLLNFFVSIGTTHWGVIGAAMLMVSAPTVILYLLGSNQIEHALAANSGVK